MENMTARDGFAAHVDILQLAFMKQLFYINENLESTQMSTYTNYMRKDPGLFSNMLL